MSPTCRAWVLRHVGKAAMMGHRVLRRSPVVLWRWTGYTPEAAIRARTALFCALDQLGYDADLIDDIVIAVSELVANAIEHAVGPYEMRLRMAGEEVICEVDDHDPRLPKVPPFIVGPMCEAKEQHRGGGLEALASTLAERGRGLRIVHVLTKGAWGFRVSGPTKTAWLTIPDTTDERIV